MAAVEDDVANATPHKVKKKLWNTKKISSPVGTYNEGAFHVFLCDPISLFNNDTLPYYCLPMCGIYGTEEYHLTDLLVLIGLPSHPLVSIVPELFKSSPLSIVLSEHVCKSNSDQFSVAILIHSKPCFECGSSGPNVLQVNMMYHLWGFEGSKLDEDNHITLEAGAFDTYGVLEAAQDIVEELNGLSINRIAPKIQYIHNGYCFSPHNAQVLLQESLNVHSLFSFAKHPNGKSVLTYHILPSTQDAEKYLTDSISKACTLEDLLKELNLLVSTDLPNLAIPFSIVVGLLNCLP